MKTRHSESRRSALFALFAAAVSLAAAGCATTDSPPPVPALYSSIPAHGARSVRSASLSRSTPWIVVLADADLTHQTVSFDLTPVRMDHASNGLTSAFPLDKPVKVRSWAAFRAALAPRMGKPPVGIVLTSAGQSVMPESGEPSPAMKEFV